MTLMNLTSDPQLWLTALLFIGTLYGIIALTIGLMHAYVRPRDT